MSRNAFDQEERQFSQDLDRWETAREQRQKRLIVILPCPFCGNDDVTFNEIKPNFIVITCDECGIIGPHANPDQSVEISIQRWNERKP